MKAAIYNPYLDSLGGGERYSSSFAKVLLESGFAVDLEWKDKDIKDKLEKRFGLDLERIRVVKDIKRGDGYEICFWVSDGSIPLLRARKNFLHFQIPFSDVGGSSLISRMKLYRIDKLICNSYFTKEYVDEEYKKESIVIYPPVAVDKIKPKRKENLILSVGRFSQLKQAKRQDILVKVFKRLYDRGVKDWKFILAGGSEVGADTFLKRLKKESKGYPIKILESPDFEKIRELYGKAKIFWSASGFGVDKKDPQRVEHFGITLVEAMAAKAVPIAYKAGGHKEIIAEKVNGYLFTTTKDLYNKTKKLIEDKRPLNKLARKAKEDSRVYEYERFKAQVKKLL